MIKLRNSIKIKFSIFLIVFTFLLIAIILSYLYFTNRSTILRNEKRDIKFLTQIFSDHLENTIHECVQELNGLQSQINGRQIRPDLFPVSSLDIENPIERFVIGYSPKYREIMFYRAAWNKILTTKPVKIFGGATKTHYKWVSLHKSDFNFFPKDSSQSKVWGPDITSGERMVYVSIAGNKEKINITASISLDFLVEQTLTNFNFPEETDVMVTDTSGIILFSSHKENMNQYIQRINPELGRMIKGSPISDEVIDDLHGQFIWHWRKLKIPTINVITSRNVSQIIQQLNTTFFQMILFSGFILIVVLIVVRIMAQKMTDTLRQITTVADKAAEGDFSQKIAISRQDELGILINAFNEMIDKINASYQSLRQVNIELQEKIDELTRTRAELSQKQRLALIGETISKISHEIQNKIGGVSIWIQNLEMQLKDHDSAQIYIEEMKKALQSFMAMLGNFKRFYKEPHLQKSCFQIEEVINKVDLHLSEEIQERDIRVIRKIQTKDQTVIADKDQIEEAVVNIFINALYFSPTGGKIDILVNQLESQLNISICDEGPGISKEDAGRLFQPFFTTKSSGSGLGLAIAENIIRAHGGRLSFKNRESKGACFSIQLPINEE